MSAETGATTEEVKRETPETLRLRAVSPALTVDDIDESLTWYRDIVGFHVDETWEHEGEVRGASLVAGVASIFLMQDDGAKGWDREKGEGFRLHLATAQDVDELASGIKERGGTLESEPQDTPWGARAFSLVDPSGFKLTIASERE